MNCAHGWPGIGYHKDWVQKVRWSWMPLELKVRLVHLAPTGLCRWKAEIQSPDCKARALRAAKNLRKNWTKDSSDRLGN